jgi:hypothetical protein
LTERERFEVADGMVADRKQHGDPWRLGEELEPPPDKACKPGFFR